MSDIKILPADKLFLPQPIIDDAVLAALKEDLGRAGDITTLATIPADRACQSRDCRPR